MRCVADTTRVASLVPQAIRVARMGSQRPVPFILLRDQRPTSGHKPLTSHANPNAHRGSGLDWQAIPGIRGCDGPAVAWAVACEPPMSLEEDHTVWCRGYAAIASPTTSFLAAPRLGAHPLAGRGKADGKAPPPAPPLRPVALEVEQRPLLSTRGSHHFVTETAG